MNPSNNYNFESDQDFGFEPDVSEDKNKGKHFFKLGESPLKTIPEAYKRHTKETSEFSSGLTSAMTLGTSEIAEDFIGKKSESLGLKTPPKADRESKYYKGGEFVGSIVPIEATINLIGKPLVNLAKKSPILTKQAESLARIIGTGISGATYEGTKKAIKGEMPSTEDLIEHGVSWSILDAGLQSLGLLGRFGKALFSKAKSLGQPEWKVLNETLNKARESGIDVSSPDRIASKAMSILTEGGETIESKSLQNKKVDKNVFDKLDKDAPELSEAIQPESIHPNQLEKELSETSLDNRIERIGEKPKDSKTFGENIQNDIEEGIENARKEYAPLYEKVKKAASEIDHTPSEVINTAWSTYKQLQSLKTKPTGYDTVIKQLENVLQDAGAILKRDDLGRIIGLGKPNRPSTKADKIVELGKRLNEIINYDVIDHSIKDRLRPVARAAKRDAREAFSKFKFVADMFDQAEKKFADSAKKFGRDTIRSIRKEEASEKIANLIKSPTAISDLKATLSPEQMKQVERSILDHMKGMKYDKAKEYLSEIISQLSPKTKETAQKLVRSKLPFGRESQRKNLMEGVFDELSNSFTWGARPKKTLNLWSTKKGQDLIRQGLKDNPNKKDIIKYLEKQSINDFATTVIEPDGKINFQKFNELLKNPAVKENLRHVGGQNAVSFFENLEKMSKQMERNAHNLEKMRFPEKYTSYGKERLQKMAKTEAPLKFKAKEFYNSIGVPGKTLIGMVGLLGFGIPKGVGTYVAFKVLYKLASTKKARDAFMKAAGQRTNPAKFVSAWEVLDKELED